MAIVWFMMTLNMFHEISTDCYNKESLLKSEQNTQFQHELNSTIARVYYINLAKNFKRRQMMEGWLSKQNIPFYRINAIVVDMLRYSCTKEKNHPRRCQGIVGLTHSNLEIIRNRETHGLTLVFEDDYIVEQPLQSLVDITLSLVPQDWDIIRWDCWGDTPSTFDYILNTPSVRIFSTIHKRPCNERVETCQFYGGTYAMLWRDTSLRKLDTIWSEEPFDDIDGRLTNEGELKSYCVNMEFGHHITLTGEETDIPKLPAEPNGEETNIQKREPRKKMLIELQKWPKFREREPREKRIIQLQKTRHFNPSGGKTQDL